LGGGACSETYGEHRKQSRGTTEAVDFIHGEHPIFGVDSTRHAAVRQSKLRQAFRLN